jgi:hypothetical protein
LNFPKSDEKKPECGHDSLKATGYKLNVVIAILKRGLSKSF